MKTKLIILLIAISYATIMSAQNLSITVDKKGRVGYADQEGNIVIKCQYETGMPFSDGIAIVAKSGKYGIIDTHGKIVLPLKYSQISKWSDELFLVKSGKTMGLSNHYGKLVLPVKYSHISRVNCYGKALIAQGGKLTTADKNKYMMNAKYGIIDERGNIIITPTYKGLYEFSYDGKDKLPYYEGHRLEYSYHNLSDTLVTDCEYLGFSKNGFNIYNAGIMEGNGKEILKQGLYYYVMKPHSGMVRYYIVRKKETLCGYHNLNSGKGFQVAKFNQKISDINFWTHGDFIGDLAPVNGEKWSFIDKRGQTLRSGYSSIKHGLYCGLWAASKQSGQWEVFDDSNTDVSVLSDYNDILFAKNEGDKEVFTVAKGGKYGCITRTGETVVPFVYEQALGNSYDFIPVKKNGKWGAVSPDNKTIVPTNYENLFLPSERNSNDIWIKKADSLYYHFDINKQHLAKEGYSSVNNFKKGYALVAPRNMLIIDNLLNKAQIYSPNTAFTTIAETDLSKLEGCFGYVLKNNDEIVFDKPVSTMYFDSVIKEIENRGGNTMTEMQIKDILLMVTEKNRSYDLKSVLGEEEWNY